MRPKSIAPFVGLCLLASTVLAAHAEDPPAPADVEAPEVAARPTTDAATPESGTSIEPSPERRAVLDKVARGRKARAARRLALLRWRQAAYAQQMICLAQQGSSGGTTDTSSDSYSGSSQDTTRQGCSPSYPISAYTPSRSSPAPAPSRSLAGQVLDEHRKMSQRYP